MHRLLSLAAAIAVAATTAVACAAPVVAIPDALTIIVGSFGKLTASTKGMTISVEGANCFGARASSDDILRVVVTARSETEKGSKIALDLHAQKAGECAFVIRSGRDSTSVRVRVVR